MSKQRTVGIVYNPRIQGTQELVAQMVQRLKLVEGSLVCSVEDLEQIGDRHPGVDLLVTVGGDGTILRAVKVAAVHGVTILGINMGRVGFMTELGAQDALEHLDQYLENDLWIEERAMLQASVVSPQKRRSGRQWHEISSRVYHALNEAVVGSGAVARMVIIKVTIDGAPLTVYRADGVIVATATGSTGYALSAGGPIIFPTSHDILLKPVAAHLGMGTALVLPESSRIELMALPDSPALLSVDGFIDVKLGEGDHVLIETSPYVARFLRTHPPSQYYTVLAQRLGLDPGDPPPRPML